MTAFAQCARHLQNRHPTIPRYGPKNPIYRAAHSFFISPPVSFHVRGFGAALLGSLMYSALGLLIESALGGLFPKS